MKTDLDNKGVSPSKKSRLRSSWNRVVSVCVVALIVLVVGVSSYALFSPFDDSSPLAAGLLNQGNSGEDPDAVPVDDAAAEAERAAAQAAQAEKDAQALADYENNRPSANDADAFRPGVREESGIEYCRDEVLITIDEGTTHEELNELISRYDFIETTDVSSQDLKYGYVKVVVKDGVNVPEASQALLNDNIIASPNYLLEFVGEEGEEEAINESLSLASQVQPTATLNADEWMLDSTVARNAWNIQKASNGKKGRVSVAVFDSGCRVTHEDLKDNVVATYNAISKESGNAAVSDTLGHGTHVAGIVAADSRNDVGMMGTSSDAGLVIISVINESGKAPMAALIQGFTWLLEDHDNNGLTRAQEYNVRVANMSLTALGTLDPEDAVYKKIDEAAAQGILSVCAAGNKTTTATPPYNSIPGDYATCLQVINLEKLSTSNPNDSGKVYKVGRSSGSNYNINTPADLGGNGTKDISAPGTSIWSTETTGDTSYGYKTGTSMASPAVSGIAALIFAYDPNLTPAQVQRLLEHTATDLNAASPAAASVESANQLESGSSLTSQADEGLSPASTSASKWTRDYGYGEVNAYRALQVVSARIANESLDYLTADELKLGFPDGTEVSLAQWNSTASTDDDKWTISSSNPSVIDVDNTTGKLLAKSVGAATITATYTGSLDADGSSQIKVTQKVNVTPLDLSNFTLVSEDPSKPGYLKLSSALVYTGQDLCPREQDYKTATYHSQALKAIHTIEFGSDFTVSHENNTNAGEASLTITPVDTAKYKGAKTLKYIIASQPLDVAQVEIADQVYTGTALTPKPRVTITLDSGDTVVLSEGRDYYELSPSDYSDNINPGMATVTIRAIEGHGFTGSVQGTFKIKQDIKTCSVSGILPEYKYTGSPIVPSVTVKDGDYTLVQDKDYKLEVGNNRGAGDATSAQAPYVRVIGIGEYAGTFQKTFTIIQVDIANATITPLGNYTYTGSPITPQPTVTLNGYTLVEGVDYDLEAGNNINACSSTSAKAPYVRLTGKGEYVGTLQAQFSIDPADFTKATMAPISVQTYTGRPITPKPTITVDGRTLVENVDYTLSYPGDHTSATTKALVHAEGIGNYKGSIEKYFIIRGGSSGSNDSTNAENNQNSESSQGSLNNPGSNGNQGSQGNSSQGSNQGSSQGSNQGSSQGTNQSSQGNTSNNNSGNTSNNNSSSTNNNNGSSDTTNKITMYRLYNRNNGEHFYTASTTERDYLSKIGWNYEGVAWYAPSSGTPVYRLYNPHSGDHHYTTSKSEYDALEKIGWRKEGIGWYSGGSTKLHRLFNPNEVVGTHHYTTNAAECKNLIQLGWRYEGVGWYGM